MRSIDAAYQAASRAAAGGRAIHRARRRVGGHVARTIAARPAMAMGAIHMITEAADGPASGT